jgi:hypothetical protein
MSKYELNSKQVALLGQSLLYHVMSYECADKEYQNAIKKEGQELYNLLIESHNSQESETLKHYSNYK